MGEIPRVRNVGFIGAGGELIGPRGADVPHQLFEIVVVGNKFFRECIEQFRIRRRVGNPNVIHGIDDADAVKMRPDDVDNVFGEPWVFR